MQDSRNNIMFRKVKTYSGRNNTTRETDFYKESSRIQAIKTRRDNIGEHRRVALFGSRDERYSMQQRFLEDAQLQLNMKQLRTQEEQAREQLENQQVERHRQMMDVLDTQREGQRREKLRQASQENKLAAMAKSSDSLYSKAMEDIRDKENIKKNIQKYKPNVF